ncbi:MAG: FHA domain-containing protein [Ruminococcaceae bacterium]|nr:FHA domain-containing protein [Oscillospiraceae bacterium]
MKYGKDKYTSDEVMNTTAAYGVTPFIRCLKGEFEGYDVPILSTGLLIGRDATACHLIFSDNSDVSRYHCRVTYSSKTGYFVVTDLNSTNGVYTENGQRIPMGDKLVLGPGQQFGLCGDEIVFLTVIKQNVE